MPYQRTFIREWRKHRSLTLEGLGDLVDMAAGNLSKLERGLKPYIQYQMEALAGALRCTVADLIIRPPGTGTALNEAFSHLSPAKQKQALRLIKALAEDDEAA